jgi:hypothetical protein
MVIARTDYSMCAGDQYYGWRIWGPDNIAQSNQWTASNSWLLMKAVAASQHNLRETT